METLEQYLARVGKSWPGESASFAHCFTAKADAPREVARFIKTRFAKTCAECGEGIEIGTVLMYDPIRPRGKRSFHTGCYRVAA